VKRRLASSWARLGPLALAADVDWRVGTGRRGTDRMVCGHSGVCRGLRRVLESVGWLWSTVLAMMWQMCLGR
jgi:hypothetical protein